MFRGFILIVVFALMAMTACDGVTPSKKDAGTAAVEGATLGDAHGAASSASGGGEAVQKQDPLAGIPDDPLIASLISKEDLDEQLKPSLLQCKNACHKLVNQFIQVTSEKYGEGIAPEVRKYLYKNAAPLKENCQTRCVAEFSPWVIHCILTNSYYDDIINCTVGELSLPVTTSPVAGDEEPSAPKESPPAKDAVMPPTSATPPPVTPPF